MSFGPDKVGLPAPTKAQLKMFNQDIQRVPGLGEKVCFGGRTHTVARIVTDLDEGTVRVILSETKL